MIVMSATLSGGSQGRLGLRYGGEQQGPFGAKIFFSERSLASPAPYWFELMRAFFRKSADEGRRLVFTADQ